MMRNILVTNRRNRRLFILLFALCLILFTPETAIYSVIYNFASAMVVDKAHQQNISVQALIFTRAGERELGRVIMDELGRGVTWCARRRTAPDRPSTS